MGDRDGNDTLVSNLNGDWNDFLATFTDLYQAHFRP
jgi:D-alanyl-D-alanine carboxypeptidase